MTSNYFSHDSNARNSEELLRIRMELGLSGYAVYFMLIERLREEKSYMSIKDYNVIAFDLHCDASLIKKVVENFGLFVFTEDGKYFYSESFNRRMEMKDAKSQKRSEAGKKAINKRWEKEKNKEKDTNVIPTYNERNSNVLRNDTKESKEKESKGKKSKNNHQLQDDFEKLWQLYPKKQGKTIALRAYTKAINDGVTNKEIQDGIQNYVKHLKIKNTENQYIKQGSTYFNQRSWEDELDMQPNGNFRESVPDWIDGDNYEPPKQPKKEVDMSKLQEQLARRQSNH